MINEWKQHIQRAIDNSPVWIITKEEELYKNENGEYIFFDNEKSAYEFNVSHTGTSKIPMYLSKFRVY